MVLLMMNETATIPIVNFIGFGPNFKYICNIRPEIRRFSSRITVDKSCDYFYSHDENKV